MFFVQNIVAATAAFEEMKQSSKFSKLLELVLLLGNYMNAGSKQEQSVGFELNFLVKVRNDLCWLLSCYVHVPCPCMLCILLRLL